MGDKSPTQTTQPVSERKDLNKSGGNRNRLSRRDKQKIKKRVPLKLYQRKNDIYITGKSDFKAQTKQCEAILNGEEGEVFLHAIGNAINRCINLALILVKNSDGALGYEANTSTIELIDDLHPLNDHDDFQINRRMNSCLHVRVFRQSKNVKV